MNAAENLRELSNIGRSLNSTSSSKYLSDQYARSSYTELFSLSSAGTARPARPSLDHDARVRIQLLSRHIEDMQRICLSHIEVTRHRRQVRWYFKLYQISNSYFIDAVQVYRLQQIRRILEDLREQIRYLQDCVRDSLDLVTRLRTSPNSPPAGPSGANSASNNNNDSTSNEHERPSPSTSGNQVPVAQSDAAEASERSATTRLRAFSPVQYRRFTRFLMGRLHRIGNVQDREQSQRSFGRDARLR